MKGFLLLEDGTKFYGTLFGAEVNGGGEITFCTKMCGYHDELSNPENSGKILLLTHPSVIDADVFGKNENACVGGLVIKELSAAPENWNAGGSLDEFLKKQNITGLKDADTRALMLKIRGKTVKGKIHACG